MIVVDNGSEIRPLGPLGRMNRWESVYSGTCARLFLNEPGNFENCGKKGGISPRLQVTFAYLTNQH